LLVVVLFSIYYSCQEERNIPFSFNLEGKSIEKELIKNPPDSVKFIEDDDIILNSCDKSYYENKLDTNTNNSRQATPGINISKSCINNNQIEDYNIEVIGLCCPYYTNWYLEYPNGSIQFIGTTSYFIDFSLLDPTPGQYTVIAEVVNIGADPAYSTSTFDLPISGHFVAAGTTSDLDRYRLPYEYSLPSGYDPNNIVGMGITDHHCVAWFNNGMVMGGASNDLDDWRTPYSYSLPAGYFPSDITAMAIDPSNDYCFVWFNNGKVCAGTSSDLDRYRSLYNYSVASGYSISDIVGMGIVNNKVYTWYDNGKISVGSSSDLDRFNSPYNYSLPCGYAISNIMGMAIDDSNDFVFAWYNK